MRTDSKQPLDVVTDGITSRLKQLPPKHIALFSACVAERLSGFYEPFVLKHNRSDSSLIRDALDTIWGFLQEDAAASDLRRCLANLEQATPSSEDYDSLESVLAQNICIVVDAAIRSCLEKRDGELVAGDFGIELLRAVVSHAETGFIDVGSGPGFEEFESTLAAHPLIANEIERQRADLASLESGVAFSREIVKDLKDRAERSRVDVSRVLEG